MKAQPEHENRRASETVDKQRSPFRRGILVTLGFLFVGTSFYVASYFSINLCPIYHLIGVPCPSCGMTRSYIELFKGDVQSAFQMHPLFWLAPIFILILVLFERADSKRKKILKPILYVSIALLILVWIVRMFLLFPNQEPMVWNENAVFRRIYQFFISFF